MNESEKAHWEARYAERDQIWSGRVNPWLAEVVGGLTPGRALDLGCGEGADVLWLAERGWHAVGVDISDTALARAGAEAARRDLTDRVRLLQINLSDDFPDGTFDLVSAQFLQSLVRLDRESIFAAAARAVASGGTLLIVDHGAAPPWAQHIHDHVFPTVDEVLERIDLEPGAWERVNVDAREREAIGPDGQQAVLIDNVIVLRRT
ncbi:methyltransferase domain-containing protein [Mycolicibacterium rufum]|uniref:Class I SAM-dependent methyltransferase n=1 Tax=Mycolicibacterium rufum TaxID=318424 RepID=A0A9X3BGG8_9MYCO|nr:class I SAM-dependent methyltransferase [Mycolicibacterium rufum]KGI68822.1 SAM-dependent methlyltransferase [Mycolicibacterium rufum]MCV7071004.1 class I SAM-dependent methyltransferase [Mycolicibacterium rufum]ULP34972.1 methyltransferase domain-containing protein [Mycolicibacterium rufum]